MEIISVNATTISNSYKTSAVVNVENIDKDSIDVSNVGDINGDGINDMVIRLSSAQQYLIFGRNEDEWTKLTDSDGNIDLEAATQKEGIIKLFDGEGYSFKNAGDVNNDGYEDILIGSSLIFGRSQDAWNKLTDTNGNLSLGCLDKSKGIMPFSFNQDALMFT